MRRTGLMTSSFAARGVAAVSAVLVTAAGAVPSVSSAEPVGTVNLTTLSVPSSIELLAGSEAGIAYRTDTVIGGASKIWLKAPGADPVQTSWVAPNGLLMVGRMMFEYRGATNRYSLWNGPVRTCDGWGRLGQVFLPTGWAYLDDDDNTVKVTTATDAGCTTRTFLSSTPDLHISRVFGGDANGLIIQTYGAAATVPLGYYRFDDPQHPIALSSPSGGLSPLDEIRPMLLSGALLAKGRPDPDSSPVIVRIPIDGSPYSLAAIEGFTFTATATTIATTGYHGGFSTTPVGGGPVSTQDGITGTVASDGARFYTNAAPGEPPGIYARTAANAPATLVVGAPATMYPSKQYAIALSPGRVYYSDHIRDVTRAGQPYAVRTRSVTAGPGTISLGAEQTVADALIAPLSASAGRLAFDGHRHRDPTGRISEVPTVLASPEASGNRWLAQWNYFYDFRTISGRTIYDVRTGTTTPVSSWPQGPQDLFGNYLLHARSDGSIRLRNLLTGAETVPRGAGTAIGAVALHSRWAAWVTACATHPCAQTLTVRDLSTGSTRNLSVRGTRSLDLSGGYLGFDTVLTVTRALRTLQLTTGRVDVIGNLPANFDDGAAGDVNLLPPRHFDLEDELIGWIDPNHTGKLAHLPRFIDPPRYLGNVIAPASFTTTWSMALPVSKALPTCTVTILRGTTVVRVLDCANTTGMAAVTWDGRTSTGAVAPAGTYTYRASGQDDDGYWMRHYDGILRSVTGTMTKSS